MDKYLKIAPELVFTPSAPVLDLDNLVGRSIELQRCIDSLSEAGTHLALFGKRGVGKTSLLNVFLSISGQLYPSKTIVRYECSHGDTYKDIFSYLLDEIDCNSQIKSTSTTRETRAVFEAKTPFTKGGGEKKEVRKNDIESHWSTEIRPSVLSKKYFDNDYIFVIDEFDRIVENDTLLYISDVLKAISDNHIKAEFVIVGISDNASDLIGNHPSVERCLKSINLEPFSQAGISDILNHGFNQLNIKCSRPMIHVVSNICSGFPHYAHLVGLELARHAQEYYKSIINITDYKKALPSILGSVSGSVKDSFIDFVYPNGHVNLLYDRTRDIDTLKRELIALSVTLPYKATVIELAKTASELLDRKISSLKAGESNEYKALFSVVLVTEHEVEEILKDDQEATFRYLSDSAENEFEFSNPLVKAYASFCLHKFLPEVCQYQ